MSRRKKRSLVLKEALSNRDDAVLKDEFLGIYPAAKAGIITKFCLFIGEHAEFSSLLSEIKEHLTAPVIREAEYIITLAKELEAAGAGGSLRLDLSEIGSQPYHTGIVFKVYIDGIDSAVAFGGRYNNLLANFGFDAPSVGFSLLLRKVEALMKKESMKDLNPVKAEGASFREKLKNAEKLRKEGRIVTL